MMGKSAFFSEGTAGQMKSAPSFAKDDDSTLPKEPNGSKIRLGPKPIWGMSVEVAAGFWEVTLRHSLTLPTPMACRFTRPPPPALRRWRRQTGAAPFRQPTAALPSTPLPVPGIGRPRWLVELIRCRAGESADFELEACDDKGRLALPSDLAHGPGQTDVRRRGASA